MKSDWDFIKRSIGGLLILGVLSGSVLVAVANAGGRKDRGLLRAEGSVVIGPCGEGTTATGFTIDPEHRPFCIFQDSYEGPDASYPPDIVGGWGFSWSFTEGGTLTIKGNEPPGTVVKYWCDNSKNAFKKPYFFTYIDAGPIPCSDPGDSGIPYHPFWSELNDDSGRRHQPAIGCYIREGDKWRWVKDPKWDVDPENKKKPGLFYWDGGFAPCIKPEFVLDGG